MPLTEPLASITRHKPQFLAEFIVSLTTVDGHPIFQDSEVFTFTDLKTAKATARRVVANAIKLSEKSEGEE